MLIEDCLDSLLTGGCLLLALARDVRMLMVSGGIMVERTNVRSRVGR